MEEHGLTRVARRRVIDLKEHAEKVRGLHIQESRNYFTSDLGVDADFGRFGFVC